MSVEQYDQTKSYSIGDKVWVGNYSEYWPGYTRPPTKMNFNCIKPNSPTTTGYAQPVIPYETNPNEQYYHDVWIKPQYWELIYPEWSADEKYTWGSIVKYKGNYYYASIKMLFNGNSNTPRTLPNNPPNELVDENGDRVWMITTVRHKQSSFQLCAYNLQRSQGHFQAKDKYGVDPYGSYDNTPPTSGYGIGGIGSRFGENLEVFLDYDDITAFVGNPPEDKVVLEGGDTEAKKCGVAFQTLKITGICWGLSYPIAWEDENADPLVGGAGDFYSNGDIDASPDGASPAYENPFNQEWHHTGHIYYSHNHPLFFRRIVSMKVGLLVGRHYWQQFKNPNWNQFNNLPYYIYGLLQEEKIEVQSKSGTPTDDCFDYINAIGAVLVDVPDLKNEIASVTAPSGNMVYSYHRWLGELAWSPFGEVEEND